MHALNLEELYQQAERTGAGSGVSRGRCIPGVDWWNWGDAEVLEMSAAKINGWLHVRSLQFLYASSYTTYETDLIASRL